MYRLSLRFFVSLALMFVASFARASANYPAVIQAKVASSSGNAIPAPACTLCHTSTTGGNGTIVTYFGLAMQDFGARGKDPGSLESALDTAIAQGWDSDGDEVPDLDELAAGSDPNDGPGRATTTVRPQHGCAVERGRATWTGALGLAALGLAACLRRRRREGSVHTDVTGMT